MAKAKRTAARKQPKRKTLDRQLIDDSDELAQAIIRAVGSLKPGESLEIRKVRDPKINTASTKKTAGGAARKRLSRD